MEKLYFKFKEIIIGLFNNYDIPLILKDPLKSDFEVIALSKIENGANDKVKIFFREFDNIKLNDKYLHFIEVTSEISDWIIEFLLAKDEGKYADLKLKISINLINLHVEFFIENLEFDKEVLKDCLENNLISLTNYNMLIELLNQDGLMITKWKFMDIIHVKSSNCYSKFLYLSYRYNPIYVELFCDNLHQLLEDLSADDVIRNTIQIYCDSIVDDNITEIHSNNIIEAFPESNNLSQIPNNRTELLFHKAQIPNNRTELLFHKEINPKPLNSNLLLSDASNEKHGYESDSSDDNDENIKFDNLFGEIKNKNVKEILNFITDNKTTTPETLNVRKYQEELAENGIGGKNVLICAPTGSGKTVVAIKIIQEHFKNNLGAKVSFVVPTNALVQQQCDQFKRYCKKQKIVPLSGNSKPGTVDLSLQIPYYDIFIMTCDILKQALENKNINTISICDFSLIIFDECHHCDKGHSYNKVMDCYFKSKNEKASTIPQIIGMTASTGTDKAKTVANALNTLFVLCANLDCHIVSTVKFNTSNLEEHLNIAKHEILTPGYRIKDFFEDHLVTLMINFEERMITLLGTLKLGFTIPQDKWHDKYMNFVSGLSKYSSLNLSEDSNKEIRSIGTYLEIFYRALLVNNLFTSRQSLEMIKTLQNDSPIEFEKIIQKYLKNFLSSVQLEQDDNPSLTCIKNEIINQFQKDKTSRIIIFVKEVNYAKIMENELNSSNISFMKCASFVGTNKSSEQGGATSSSHDDILKSFKVGDINILCATSVAEEGLDIENCNLVIRYGYVTNDIAMVQSRGRARAENSRYVVIVPYRLEWQVNKENLNKMRESKMYQAIESFQNMNRSEIDTKIKDFQYRRQLQQKYDDDISNVLQSSPKKSDIWKILCRKCEKYLCDSSDIRVVLGNSFVVINKDRFPNILLGKVDKNNLKIICTCKQDLGFVHKHEGVPLPNLQIKQCLIKLDDEIIMPKKWKDVPFTVLKSTSSELMKANNDIYRV